MVRMYTNYGGLSLYDRNGDLLLVKPYIAQACPRDQVL